LVEEGLTRIAQKVGEEGVELALAAVAQNPDESGHREAADLLCINALLLEGQGLVADKKVRSLADDRFIRLRHGRQGQFTPSSPTVLRDSGFRPSSTISRCSCARAIGDALRHDLFNACPETPGGGPSNAARPRPAGGGSQVAGGSRGLCRISRVSRSQSALMLQTSRK